MRLRIYQSAGYRRGCFCVLAPLRELYLTPRPKGAKAKFLSKRLVNRRTLVRKKPGPAFGNVKAVFESNPELTINYDRWFVAKAHARLNRRLVPAHEVSPFMTIESDAVARAMRQSRDLVVGAKTGVGDHFARGRIDGFTRCADSRGRK